MSDTAKAFVILITGLSLIVPALADEATPANDEGRYAFSKVSDGFLRLDARTGEVSLCSQRSVGWACQAVPEDRAVLEDEIARLRKENGALKKDLLARGLPLPAGALPDPPILRDGGSRPQLNDNSDLDRVVAFIDRLWHRLVEVIAKTQKQGLNKS